MKKTLKYIKINGVIKSTGEYTIQHEGDFKSGHDHVRTYGAVTIIDNEGEEVHFHKLAISKRLDGNISLDQPATFYILRLRDGDIVEGVVYALDVEGKKLFYPETAITNLCSLGVRSSKRLSLFPLFFPFAIVAIGVPIAVGLIMFFSFYIMGSIIIGLFSAIAVTMWPIFSPKSRVEIRQMYKALQSEGFDTAGKASSKY